MRLELNQALDEKWKLKEMFNPNWLVKAMTKVVSNNMTMKESPKTSQGTQYKGAFNYVSRLRQPELACGANGKLKPNVSCHYCKDRGHIKDNCVCLNNKISGDIQLQEQVMAAKQVNSKGAGPHIPKNRSFSDLGPI